MKLSIGEESGFTLVELIISLVMIGVITTAAFSFYLNQHNQWIIQEQISEMQQNVRVSMDELVQHIRMAGGGSLPGSLPAIWGTDTDPDTILVRYNLANCSSLIEKKIDNYSDPIYLDTMSCVSDTGRIFICVPLGDPSYPYGEWVAVCQINQSGSWKSLLHTEDLSYNYPVGSEIFQMEEYKYYIDQTTDSTHPVLMRAKDGENPVVFAENIENLDFSYILATGDTLSVPGSYSKLRNVTISLVARTERSDPDFSGDGYRRRDLNTTVKMRNFGL